MGRRVPTRALPAHRPTRPGLRYAKGAQRTQPFSTVEVRFVDWRPTRGLEDEVLWCEAGRCVIAEHASEALVNYEVALALAGLGSSILIEHPASAEPRGGRRSAVPSSPRSPSRLLKNPRRRGRVARGRAPQSAAYEPQARRSRKCAARNAANRRRGGEPGPARPAPRRTGPVFQHPASVPPGKFAVR